MSRLVLIVILFIISTVSSQYAQDAKLFSGRDGTGYFFIVPTTDYVYDLSQHQFNNLAQSVCLVGTWLFFDLPNFNSVQQAGMEYIFEPNYYCINFNNLGGFVSSVKFVGNSSDYRADSFTVFRDIYFQGDEEYIVADLPNLRSYGAQASFIATGHADWTIYDRTNYQGNAICIITQNSPDYTPGFVPDMSLIDPPIPHGKIASIRKGCFSQQQFSVNSLNAKNTKSLNQLGFTGTNKL